MGSKPCCPHCKRTKSVIRQGEYLWCTNCHCPFDDVPQEGARLELEDERLATKRNRIGSER